MAEDRGSNRRPSLLQLGPAWITAIAGLITALTAAGFFAGRATAPGDGTSPTPSLPAAIRTAGPPPATTSAAPLVSPGTALTHYTVDISDTYGINITDKPAFTVGRLLAGITVTNFVVTISSYATLDITVWQGTGAGS